MAYDNFKFESNDKSLKLDKNRRDFIQDYFKMSLVFLEKTIDIVNQKSNFKFKNKSNNKIGN